MRVAPILLLCLALACAHSNDPVAYDPARDRDDPPQLVPTSIPSHGEAMNAIVYVAAGAGPHPTALFLHGLPGNERNLDLAQTVRRAGWNAVFFHYRGAWGSEGDYSFQGVLEDVASSVAWLRSPERGAELRIHPDRIALIGHSLGGFAALRVGAELDEVGCIASISGANLAALGQAARGDAAFATQIAARFEALTGPLQGTSGRALLAELIESVQDFDVLSVAPVLAGKSLLLVAGSRDQVTPPGRNHDPLVATLEAMGPSSLSALTLDADHAYSQQRIALARALVGWLNGPCSKYLSD